MFFPFEIFIGHPSGNIRGAVGYTNLELIGEEKVLNIHIWELYSETLEDKEEDLRTVR